MVVEMLNDAAEMPVSRLLAGVVLSLAGLNHLFNPGDALVAQVLNMVAEFAGVAAGSGLISLISMAAGVVVLVIGLGMGGTASEDLGLY